METMTQLLLVWIAIFLSSYIARKLRLTPVLFFLFFGMVMVNTGLLPVVPDPFLEGLGEIGIILIMFALGFEENTSTFVASVKRTWGIALIGGVVPFLIAYGLADWFWGDTNISLLAGLTMTATAVSLTMISLKDEGLAGTKVSTGIMTAAVLDDIASLALVAALVPIATGAAPPSVAGFGLILAKAIGFFLLITVIGLWVFPTGHQKLNRWLPIIGKYGVKDILAINDGRKTTLAMLIIAVGIGLLAHAFGFHAAVGAYMAGLILREEYFPADDPKTGKTPYRQSKAIIDDVAFIWIGPVFFVGLGAKLQFDAALFLAILPETALLTVALIIGQVTSAAFAARYTAGFTGREALLIGFGMLGRAELAFVVMDIGYGEHGIFTTEVFYVLMGTAFWLNVAVPLSIRFWKPYYNGERHLPWIAPEKD